MSCGVSVDTLPLAGRDQGWEAIGPNDRASPHLLLASPGKGEVPSGA